MEWFRVYGEVVHDRKLRRIAAKMECPMAEVIGVWVTFLAAANESTPRGTLPDYQPEDLAATLQMGLGRAKKFITAFGAAGLFSPDGIKQWETRQFSSDSSTERVQKHRNASV